MAKILVVDDEQVLVKGIKFNLEHEGYQVEVGCDGEQAVELASFDYFNIDAVLSYLTRINIVARWSSLDPKRGREMFERIMAELDGKDLVNKQ